MYRLPTFDSSRFKVLLNDLLQNVPNFKRRFTKLGKRRNPFHTTVNTRIDLYVLDKLQSFWITFDFSWDNMHVFKIQSHVTRTRKMEKICSQKFLWNNCLAYLHCKNPSNFDVSPSKGAHCSDTHHVTPNYKNVFTNLAMRRKPFHTTVNDTSTFGGHAYKK